MIAILVDVRIGKLKKSEFASPMPMEKAVKVEHMVTAVVVVLCPAVGGVVAFVPAVFQSLHGLGVLPVHPLKEVGVDRLAVVSRPALVDADRPADLGFMCRHDVHKVLDLVGLKAALP